MRKCVDDAAIQNALMQAFDIVENIGVVFESENGDDYFDTIARRGARVEGDKIFIPRHLLEEALETTPKKDYSATGSNAKNGDVSGRAGLYSA